MSDSVIKRILPVLIGIALTVLLLVGLGYISRKRAQVQRAEAPLLRIIAPEPNAQLDSPLVLRFTSTQPLDLMPTGWGAGTFHLHARINDVEHMPAVNDIERVDSGYTWRLVNVPRGPIEARLGWADQAHRELAAGASQTVNATLE